MSTPDVPALRALLEASTPGEEWRGGRYCDGSIRVKIDGEWLSICSEMSVEDASFVAAIRNALPALLDAFEDRNDWIDAARSEAARVNELMEEIARLREIYKGTKP